MKIFIAQLKCPSNHCVIALAGEYESLDAAQALGPKLTDSFKQCVGEGMMNNECGLCHATNLHVDIQPTIFKSMDEAGPWLEAEERKQMAIMQAIKASRN